jgi:serine/threonine protein kinase
LSTRGNIDNWKKLGRTFPKSGQGECQLVERATAPASEKFVLKTMRPEQSGNLARRARFEQEILALRRLSDPHILRIEDFGVDARGVPYVVTPYCALGSLRPELLPLGTIPETLRLFLGICRGVAHAHEAGVVHRDLKPDNIFLNELRSPIVGDFGLCFLLDGSDTDDDRITETQEVAAARWFGAPEARDGRLEEVTTAADVYSLGKLLHWMLSSGKVFDRENHRAERNMLGRNVADRREHELVHELLDRMIAFAPVERYQSAVLVVEAVTNLIAVIEAGGRPILRNFAHRCSFCGQGEYEFRNGPEDSHSNQVGSQSLGLSAHLVNPSNSTYFFWMVAICNKCAHVQFFRPDLVPEARKNWSRDRKTTP